MPGHAIAIDEVDSTLKEFKLLEELVIEHDAIFLLTDSRESRWLPTVLCQAHDKICVNTALGFDSFVVMRHGNYDTPIKKRLSCYFCSDVVAPVNNIGQAMHSDEARSFLYSKCFNGRIVCFFYTVSRKQ
ncbi:uncharacterized protein LOC135145573 isoform X3 [Zophobas morio]|uniref:uncharacterized protein LOC135145573 isoform X3 n=1 Tax=Zophobas morio TaxID=2755281 RepID=UPI003083CAED